MAELKVGIKADTSGAKRIVRSLKEIKKAAGLTATAMTKTTAAASSTSVAMKTTVSASGQLATTQNLAAVASAGLAKTLGGVAARATETTVAETATTKATNRLTAAFARLQVVAQGALAKTAAGAAGIGTQMKTAAGSLVGASTAVVGFGAAAVIGIGVGVKMAKDFERSMAQIQGLVGLTADELDAMKGPLERIGRATAKGPNELAEALFFITSAGLRGTAALEVLESSAKGAAAGLGETKSVADAVTSAMNAYGPANLSAARATDILVATVKEGKAAADSIAGALGQILPTASELGIEFEELGGVIAALTRIGLGADQASTALGATMAAIQKPGADAKAALLEFGLSAEGLRKTVREEGLLAGLQEMKEAFGDNETALTRVVPNIRALRAVLPLIGRNAGDVAVIFDNVADSAGDMERAFAIVEETTGDKLDKALTDMKFDLKAIGETFLPLVAKIAQIVAIALKGLTIVITSVGDAFAFAGKSASLFGETIAAAFIGSDDPIIRNLNNIKELQDELTRLEKGGTLRKIFTEVGNVDLTGNRAEQIKQLEDQLALSRIIELQNGREELARQRIALSTKDQADTLEEIAKGGTVAVVIDEDLLEKGKKSLIDLEREVEFLTSDLVNLQENGKEGIGLASDLFETRDIMKALQGDTIGTSASIRALVNNKRALAMAIDDVTDAFTRQDAANDEIDELILNTGMLAEQIAILKSGGSLVEVESAQKARQLMADLGDDTDHTKDSLTQLFLQQKAYNDILELMDVTPADELRQSLQVINDLQAGATDQSALAQLALDAKVLEDGIVAAEIAAAGLDSNILLGIIPDEKQIEDALEPFRRLMEEGLLDPAQFELISAGIKEKVEGTFNAMEEFAIQAARNIESALADFLYDPFSDGLDGMLVSFGETLRKMTSDLLANALLQQFLSSFSGSGGILGAVAGALTTKAEGGPVAAGKDFLVGEEGPEIFTPRQSGNIIPNGAMGGQAPAPVVEVGGPTIVNTLDDGAIVAAFNRGGGSDVILNNMTENKAAFRSALGIE